MEPLSLIIGLLIGGMIGALTREMLASWGTRRSKACSHPERIPVLRVLPARPVPHAASSRQTLRTMTG